jgi:serine/threonine-protein kinase HipA
MTSTSEDAGPDDLYVWTWLPLATTPVVAGRINRRSDGTIRFAYGTSYLDLDVAVSLYEPELPLRYGWQNPQQGLKIASCLRDAAPDAWGQRVVNQRLAGDTDADLGLMTYFLNSGSDRIGALDFQRGTHYVERGHDNASLDELQHAAELIQEGIPLTSALDVALAHGTTVGGARPKVTLVDENGVGWIAKLSSSADPYPAVNWEALGMSLARRCGIEVPQTEVTTSLGKQVLLVKRFDRPALDRGGFGRRHMVSGLTMCGFDEMQAMYCTYPDILDVIKGYSPAPELEAVEMFKRIGLNMMVSNFDDHARNTAALWDGLWLTLAPAYDISPGPRSGETGFQAMAFGRGGEKESSLVALAQCAPTYGLSVDDGRALLGSMVEIIEHEYQDAADEARLTAVDRKALWGRQVLNIGTTRGL